MFLSFGIIAQPALYLQFYNILLPQIIDNNVRSGLISGLGFNIIITCAINDWFQIEQELFSSIFLFESFLQWSKNLCKCGNEMLHDQPHIEFSILHKQILCQITFPGKNIVFQFFF